MKTTYKFFLVALCFCAFTNKAMGQSYSGGSGTEKDPYLISSKADMETLAEYVNAGVTYEGKYFLLTKDLKTFNTVSTVIGNEQRFFSGNFNGGGYEIVVSISKTMSNSYAGLFTYIKNATIENLTVSGNVELTINRQIDYSSTTPECPYIAGICTVSENSSFINCCNAAIVTIKCSVLAYNSSACNVYAGGICASGGSFVNCLNKGNISAGAGIIQIWNNVGSPCPVTLYVGGISGSGNSFSKCCNTGTISGTATRNEADAAIPTGPIGFAGGISGRGGDVSNCYNTGLIVASGCDCGGICASGSNINNCYNTGNISYSSSGNKNSSCGGICSKATKVENSFAANATVSVGYRIAATGTVNNCYALSTMKIGSLYATSENTATGRNGADVPSISSFQSRAWFDEYLGWDFDNIWQLNPGEFPTFKAGNSSGIPAISTDKVTIYPNPVQETFYIQGITRATVITLSDISGKTVMQQVVAPGEPISIQYLPKGVYIVHAADVTSKIIKK